MRKYQYPITDPPSAGPPPEIFGAKKNSVLLRNSVLLTRSICSLGRVAPASTRRAGQDDSDGWHGGPGVPGRVVAVVSERQESGDRMVGMPDAFLRRAASEERRTLRFVPPGQMTAPALRTERR